jgi:hypothetical protein
VRSKKTSDPLSLEGLVISDADIQAMRRDRAAIVPFPLSRLDELFPRIFPVSARRRTSEGWEPFRLGEQKEP